MANELTLDQIQAQNPTAIPDGTDLFFSKKADGSPAAYTLDQLKDFVNGTEPLAYTPLSGHYVINQGVGISETSVPTRTFSFVDKIFDNTNIGATTDGVKFNIPSRVRSVSIELKATLSRATTVNDIFIMAVKNNDVNSPVANIGVVGDEGDSFLLTANNIPVKHGDYLKFYVNNGSLAWFSVAPEDTYLKITVNEHVAV